MELCESRVATNAIKAGVRAPDFTLADTEGNEISSTDLSRKGPVIVVFFRGLWCWYSHANLVALEAINSEFNNKGVSIIAVSPQLHFRKADIDRKQAISFPLLCDAYSRVAIDFKVAWRLSSQLKQTYFELGANLDKLNGTDCDLLPVISLFIIDRQGAIVYSEVNTNYVQLINVHEILVVLDNIASVRKKRVII
ncbi:peroxiredoxin-like family protein [Pseudomonas sp.]|uniref:peroxiredoxin-like family protein n=1 Tax=Pseudomonas sp. TaxID=306 RepID=UPI003A980ED5